MFRTCTKEDIRRFIDLIENEMNYRASTIQKYKKILKYFYKVIYGKNEFYPEQVKWFSIKVSKDKARESFDLDNAEYLEEDEIKIVTNSASSVQRKATISCMYESGARPEEFLLLLDNQPSNNFIEGKSKISVDPALFPNKPFIILNIRRVLKYSVEEDAHATILDHDSNEITVEQLVDRYYDNPSNYFDSEDKEPIRVREEDDCRSSLQNSDNSDRFDF
jgi:hypothetical protein